jgi:putative acetyltransferase
VLTIRPEQPEDQAQVFEVNRQAFGQEDEAHLVQALRRAPSFIPELSLVAVEDERVVGHILFTRIAVRSGATTHVALALAPMAVLPGRQGIGIGASLVRRGLAEAGRLGHRLVFVVGHPGYYPRFGFVPGEPVGVSPPFMVRELQPNALAGIRGEVEYPPEFGERAP